MVPDVSQLSLPGVKAQAVSQLSGQGRGEGGGMEQDEGFTGIKGLGVRDLTYKLCFLASSVTAGHQRVYRETKAISLDGLIFPFKQLVWYCERKR